MIKLNHYPIHLNACSAGYILYGYRHWYGHYLFLVKIIKTGLDLRVYRPISQYLYPFFDNFNKARIMPIPHHLLPLSSLAIQQQEE
jgi:hypothetical protein